MLAAALMTTVLLQDGIKSESFKGEVRKKVAINYAVHLPDGYDADRRKKWPVMLFLHGAGERGEDIKLVNVHGPMKEILKGRKIPMIVVAPQCPADSWWDADTLTGLMDSIERKYRVDKDREYLTGISMGGFGTWALAASTPNRFAAIAPVCGGGNARTAGLIKHIPIWVTHGDQDMAVNIRESQAMVDALKRQGANPKFDIIVGGGHDVWSDFYARDDFYSWLMEQKRAR